MSLADKLSSLSTAKQSIKSALTSKGQDMSTVPFTNYGDTITSLNTTQLFDYCACYISPTGSDSNTGTKSSPFKTLNYCIKNGYNIIGLLKGTYNDLPNFKKTDDYYYGSILVGEDGAVLDGNNTESSFVVNSNPCTFINLIFKNFTGNYIKTTGNTTNDYNKNVKCINCSFILGTTTTASLIGWSYHFYLYYSGCDFIGESQIDNPNGMCYLFNCYHDTFSNGTTGITSIKNNKTSPNFPNRLV